MTMQCNLHVLQRARGRVCPTVTTKLSLRVSGLSILSCVGGSRCLKWSTVAPSPSSGSDQWPAPAWAGPGWDDRRLPNLPVRLPSVTWPWSYDPSGAANSVAAPVSSCSGKTFQQLASDCSRNICNVRHWWESIPPAATEYNFKITELLN